LAFDVQKAVFTSPIDTILQLREEMMLRSIYRVR